jgi:uncharacterized membrane protein YqgA involved in biofilm formation
MNGAFLNALGILLGALFGLARRAPLAARTQAFYRAALGVFTLFAGARLVADPLGPGFLTALTRLLIGLLAVILGCWTGKLLGLQKMSNWLGRRAGGVLAAAAAHPPGRPGAGLAACVVLFGVAPLGWLGAVEAGLTGRFYLLAAKALMDALAMAGFVKWFGWLPALSAFPVLALFGAVAWGCEQVAAPFCQAHHLAGAVTAATGWIACAVSLVIFEVRRVELANYLPALVLAPLLEWLWRG